MLLPSLAWCRSAHAVVRHIAVVSHNKIEMLRGVSSLAALRKLSAANNRVRVLPDLSALHFLQELRMHGNYITALPANLNLNIRCVM